jgi:hypothetical protein
MAAGDFSGRSKNTLFGFWPEDARRRTLDALTRELHREAGERDDDVGASAKACKPGDPLAALLMGAKAVNGAARRAAAQTDRLRRVAAIAAAITTLADDTLRRASRIAARGLGGSPHAPAYLDAQTTKATRRLIGETQAWINETAAYRAEISRAEEVTRAARRRADDPSVAEALAASAAFAAVTEAAQALASLQALHSAWLAQHGGDDASHETQKKGVALLLGHVLAELCGPDDAAPIIAARERDAWVDDGRRDEGRIKRHQRALAAWRRHLARV